MRGPVTGFFLEIERNHLDLDLGNPLPDAKILDQTWRYRDARRRLGRRATLVVDLPRLSRLVGAGPGSVLPSMAYLAAGEHSERGRRSQRFVLVLNRPATG